MTRRVLTVIAMSFLVTIPLDARASLRPAADLDLALGRQAGWGFDGRLGYELDFVAIKLVPEIGAGLTSFAASPDKEGHEILHGFAGARLRFLGVITPSFFAHVGYGRISTTGALPNDVTAFGPSADAGAAVELTVLPLIDFGLHAGVTFVLPGSAPARPSIGNTIWAFVGAQMTLRVP